MCSSKTTAIRAIFLHGGPGYLDYLESFFANQFPPEIECVFYSQLQEESTTLDDLVEEVAHHVPNDKNTILIGHSWGGALAIECMRRKANPRIKGIVLIGSYLCGDDATTEYEKELSILQLKNPSTEQVFLSPRELEASGDLIKRLNMSFNVPVFRKIWDSFAPGYDARKFVQAMSTPILNIFGEKDIRVPARRVRTYAELNDKIKNIEIMGAGHFPFILGDDRARVVRAIQLFIDSVGV